MVRCGRSIAGAPADADADADADALDCERLAVCVKSANHSTVD
jgi:hypothetical protein